jgi:hypothetical protein
MCARCSSCARSKREDQRTGKNDFIKAIFFLYSTQAYRYYSPFYTHTLARTYYICIYA